MWARRGLWVMRHGRAVHPMGRVRDGDGDQARRQRDAERVRRRAGRAGERPGDHGGRDGRAEVRAMQQRDDQRSDNLDKNGDEQRPRLLVVLTGADTWTLADGTSHPTGFWAEEFVEPMRVFRDAGVDTTAATPHGAAPPVDAATLSADG